MGLSNVVSLVSAQRPWDILVRRRESRPVPSFFFVDDFQLVNNEPDHQDSSSSNQRRVALFHPLSQNNNQNKQDSHKSDWYWDYPTFKSILLSISTRKDDGLSSFGISASERHIVDDIIDNSWTASYVDDLVKMRITSDPTSQKSQLFQIACSFVYTVTANNASKMNPKNICIIVKKGGL